MCFRIIHFKFSDFRFYIPCVSVYPSVPVRPYVCLCVGDPLSLGSSYIVEADPPLAVASPVLRFQECAIMPDYQLIVPKKKIQF